MIVINLFLTTSVLNDVISKNIYEGKRVFLGVNKISVIINLHICTEAKIVKMIKTIIISLAKYGHKWLTSRMKLNLMHAFYKNYFI